MLWRHLAWKKVFYLKALKLWLHIKVTLLPNIFSWSVNSTRKWYSCTFISNRTLSKTNTGVMVPPHLPEEHTDSVRLWMDPAEAAGAGWSVALVTGRWWIKAWVRVTEQQTVTGSQLCTGNLQTVKVLDWACQTSEHEKQEAIWGMP